MGRPLGTHVQLRRLTVFKVQRIVLALIVHLCDRHEGIATEALHLRLVSYITRFTLLFPTSAMRLIVEDGVLNDELVEINTLVLRLQSFL